MANGTPEPTKKGAPPNPYADLEKRLSAPPPEIETPASTGRDPVASAVDWAAKQLPEATPDLVRAAGRLLIPQNTPELAATLLTMPVGGPLAGAAGKVGLSWLAKRSLPALAARTGLTAAGTAAAGAATGHDPTESAVAGGVSRLAGEGAGKLAQSIVQSRVTNRMMARFTGNVADTFRETIGRWLPNGGRASDERIIQSVLADEPSRLVGEAMNAARKKHADTWIRITDIRSFFDQAGIEPPKGHLVWPNASGGAPGAHPTVDLGMVWPPIRRFEERLPGMGLPEGPKALGGATPGALPPKGAAALPGEASPKALPPAPVEMVKYGDVYMALDAAQGAMAHAPLIAGPEAMKRAALLEFLHAESARRLNDPAYLLLQKEYARTKTLSQWLRGGQHGEGAAEKILTREGALSPEGYQALLRRLATNDTGAGAFSRMDRAFRPDELAAFGHALNWDLARGLAVGETGASLTDLLPSASFWPGGGHLFWHPKKAPGPGWMPGFERERTVVERLARPAARALTSQWPMKFVAPAREEE